MDTRPAMSEQIGPSMSTEPGWMAVADASSLLLASLEQAVAAINPSMLLSFERPAPVGRRADASFQGRDDLYAEAGRRSCLSTVLEHCTEATSAAIDKRRLI
jgi:hypothetical protein